MHRIHRSNVSADGSTSVEIDTIAVAAEFCERCYSDLVQPIEAKAEQAGTVTLTLRCPECEHVRIGQCSWDEARSFGRSFAAGKAKLRLAYNELADENFRDELDCFVLALATDLIGPDDFTPFRFGA
ncbi:MAG: hypothetical protein ACRDKI_05880 [Solirubrobacterales bacterium]